MNSDETAHDEPGHMVGAPPPAQHASYTYGRRPRDLVQQLRTGAIWVLFAFGVLSLIVAYQSLMSVLDIWFEYQYEPIARGLLAVLLGVVAVLGIVFLVRRHR